MGAFAVLFYSYSTQWFVVERRGSPASRVLVNGVAFGTLAVILMIARIRVADDVYIDARHIPIALIALFEGWATGLVAGAVPVAYRLWQGGAGAWAGVAGLVATVLLGGAAHAWARRQGGVGPGHGVLLAVAVFLATAGSFLLAGAYATELFARSWLKMLLTSVLGIAIIARLFQHVAAQAQMAADQQRFRAALDEATDAVRIVDPATRQILDCNRRDSEISGYPREDLIGRDVREFWPEAPVPRAFGQPFRRRSGEIVAVDCLRRVVQHGGRAYEIVTYRESAEREAREASERDAAQLKAVTLLAAGAAHEINNPLAIVMGSLDLLGRRVQPGTQEARWIDQALEGVRRIRDIVMRMSRFTRVETTPPEGNLPPILDIVKSTAAPEREAR